MNSQASANKRNKLNQLFGVQIEVTSLLLEAERRKLKVLQQELNSVVEFRDITGGHVQPIPAIDNKIILLLDSRNDRGFTHRHCFKNDSIARRKRDIE